MSLYTPTIQRIFKTTKCPHRGFIVDLVEQDEYLELRVYRENIEEFNETQKLALADYLFKLQSAIELSGVKCFIQGSENPVPYKKWEGRQ